MERKLKGKKGEVERNGKGKMREERGKENKITKLLKKYPMGPHETAKFLHGKGHLHLDKSGTYRMGKIIYQLHV